MQWYNYLGWMLVGMFILFFGVGRFVGIEGEYAHRPPLGDSCFWSRRHTCAYILKGLAKCLLLPLIASLDSLLSSPLWTVTETPLHRGYLPARPNLTMVPMSEEMRRAEQYPST